jgi:hypothetical protein
MKNYWLGNWGFALIMMFLLGFAGEASAQRIVVRPQIYQYNYNYQYGLGYPYSYQQSHYGYGYGYNYGYGYYARPTYEVYPYRPYQYYGNYYRPNVYSPWYRR